MSTQPIRRAALNLLARREHSAIELSRKLRMQGFDDKIVQLTLQQLTEEGLLSQTRYTEAYIHSRRQKGYGPLRIRSELLARGITEAMIEPILQSADNGWVMHAQQVWQKRFKGLTPKDFKARAQQMRFLQYRGFTTEQIEKLFS